MHTAPVDAHGTCDDIVAHVTLRTRGICSGWRTGLSDCLVGKYYELSCTLSWRQTHLRMSVVGRNALFRGLSLWNIFTKIECISLSPINTPLEGRSGGSTVEIMIWIDWMKINGASLRRRLWEQRWITNTDLPQFVWLGLYAERFQFNLELC